jgi:hypothetical protein
MKRFIGPIIRLSHGGISSVTGFCSLGFIISFIAFIAAAIFGIHDATPTPDAVHQIDLRDHSVHYYITIVELYACICTGSALAAFAIAGGTGTNFCEWIERKFPPDQWSYTPLKKNKKR